jgi:hypothetical protein
MKTIRVVIGGNAYRLSEDSGDLLTAPLDVGTGDADMVPSTKSEPDWYLVDSAYATHPLGRIARAALQQAHAEAEVCRVSMCGELRAYCAGQGLALMSADELALQPDVTAEQREWLVDYVSRWDSVFDS